MLALIVQLENLQLEANVATAAVNARALSLTIVDITSAQDVINRVFD